MMWAYLAAEIAGPIRFVRGFRYCAPLPQPIKLVSTSKAMVLASHIKNDPRKKITCRPRPIRVYGSVAAAGILRQELAAPMTACHQIASQRRFDGQSGYCESDICALALQSRDLTGQLLSDCTRIGLACHFPNFDRLFGSRRIGQSFGHKSGSPTDPDGTSNDRRDFRADSSGETSRFISAQRPLLCRNVRSTILPRSACDSAIISQCLRVFRAG